MRRDPYGVRALYFARVPGGWVASTDYDLVLRLVESPTIDETVYLDCITARYPLDIERTMVEQISRVPPGATVRLMDDRAEVVSRYEPPPTQIRDGRAPRTIVDEFWRLLLTATSDRLRQADDVVVLLSGGIDSNALAAAATEAVGPARVRAITIGFEHRIDDREPALARRSAEHLGIEWTFVPVDDNVPFAPWFRRPRGLAVRPATRATRRVRDLTAGAHVLYGWGGDLVARGDNLHWARRLRSGQWLRAAGEAIRTMVLHGQRPGFRAHRLHRKVRPIDVSNLPLAGRLRDRARARAEEAAQIERGWVRGVDRMHAGIHPFSFELLEPIDDGPVRTFPFFDTRLADWAVGVPTAPWFIDKEIIRAALRGRVPDEIRLRPKTPLAAEPRLEYDAEDTRAFRTVLQTDEVARRLDVDACLEVLDAGEVGLGRAVPIVRSLSVSRVVAELTEFPSVADDRPRPWEVS